MLHRHKKHWLFHATMWVCAVCVLLAFAAVSWKLSRENNFLFEELVRVKTEAASLKGELRLCSNKKAGLEKSVEGIVEENTGLQGSDVVEDGVCTKEGCLFRKDGSVIGFNSFQGYLSKQIVADGLNEVNKAECSSFVVTNTNEELLKKFPEWYKNDKGQLIIIIDPAQLSTQNRQILTGSSEKKPVSLGVILREDHREVSQGCYTPVDLVSIK